jgi:sulfate permease, SulP family
MAYAALAGLPVVYGLYASFLPVMIASMWGASRFLHTGPVALLSLMSVAAIEPLASRGSDEFIALSISLALLVGVLRFGLGAMRLGVLINLASHPVINGFTNAAALIIGLSLLNGFINVPMPRSDLFLRDLWHVIELIPYAHGETIAFGVGTLLLLTVMKRYLPRWPSVLIAVALSTWLSWAIDFQRQESVSAEQIMASDVREDFLKFAALEDELAQIKQQQSALRKQLANRSTAVHDYALDATLLRLDGEERSLKKQLYGLRVAVFRHSLRREIDAEGRKMFYTMERATLQSAWHLTGIRDGQFILSGGGQVVGNIPAGLPAFTLPNINMDILSTLLGTALIMALIGFMEATSISRALAVQSREKIDPNQELMGQGLANIVGSFFHSYTVSGSFSRSAVAARSGACSGFYAIVSALAVLITIMYLTEYFYHLPLSVLAAIVMSAVFSLIDLKTLRHTWRVRRIDAVVGVVTFIATLWMAPQLANGVLVGVALTVLVFLHGVMQPRSEVLGMKSDGTLAGAVTHDLAPISDHYVLLRFDASLVFINSAYFEEAITKVVAQYPATKAILVMGNGINRIDATGEEKVRALAADLKAAGVTLMFSGLKQPVRETFVKAGLDQVIGNENIFPRKELALAALRQRYDGNESLAMG